MSQRQAHKDEKGVGCDNYTGSNNTSSPSKRAGLSVIANSCHLTGNYSTEVHMGVSKAVTRVRAGNTFVALEVVTATDAVALHITLRLNFWKL